MQKDQKVLAKHKLNGSVNTFELVATPLKRQKEGSAPKFYPWFSDNDTSWDNLVSIFGAEMLQELAIDALNREFQLLYFQRSPSRDQIPVIKDGKPATIERDGKVIPVTQEDETPRMDKFLGFIEDENLSGRQITSEYCMRKVMQFSKEKNMVKAMEYMQKAQALMIEEMAKASKS